VAEFGGPNDFVRPTVGGGALKYRGLHYRHPPLGRTLGLNPDTPRCQVRSDYISALPYEIEPLCHLIRERFGASVEGQIFSEFPRSAGFVGRVA
jgi:hypothetical protein